MCTHFCNHVYTTRSCHEEPHWWSISSRQKQFKRRQFCDRHTSWVHVHTHSRNHESKEHLRQKHSLAIDLSKTQVIQRKKHKFCYHECKAKSTKPKRVDTLLWCTCSIMRTYSKRKHFCGLPILPYACIPSESTTSKWIDWQLLCARSFMHMYPKRRRKIKTSQLTVAVCPLSHTHVLLLCLDLRKCLGKVKHRPLQRWDVLCRKDIAYYSTTDYTSKE